MKRNLKVLGAIVAAMFAMGAVASAASAAEFHSSSENTTIEGSQTNTHHFSNGTFDVTCSTATFKGSQSGKTASNLTITPTYSGCHVIILFTFSATVNFNGCDYDFSADGDVTVDCNESGNKIQIKAAGCTIEIGEQTIEGGVSYENNEAKSAVTVNANATGIAYNQFGSTCGTSSGTNGTYSGKASVTGADEGVPSEIWVE